MMGMSVPVHRKMIPTQLFKIKRFFFYLERSATACKYKAMSAVTGSGRQSVYTDWCLVDTTLSKLDASGAEYEAEGSPTGLRLKIVLKNTHANKYVPIRLG